MKKIFKFIAPNGEYVEWGEFDKKKHIVALEVEKFFDDGVLAETQRLDFILPEDFKLGTELNIVSSYRRTGFGKTTAPDQDCLVDKADDEDPREILND